MGLTRQTQGAVCSRHAKADNRPHRALVLSVADPHPSCWQKHQGRQVQLSPPVIVCCVTDSSPRASIRHAIADCLLDE